MHPLLVRFDSDSDKACLLSPAPACIYPLNLMKYIYICIAVDMTRFEETDIRNLLKRLKRRKSNSENGIIICT